MSNYQEKLANQIASLPSLVRTAKSVEERFGSIIRKYKGGLPYGFVIAMITVESGGNPNAIGDASLGERGLMQVASSTEKDFGVPSGFRLEIANNIWLGCLELNAEARRLSLKYPSFISNGSWDQWLLARLVFALGKHGLTSRLDKAIARGYVSYGNAYSGLVRYMGSHEPDTKEWYRIVSVGAIQKVIADIISPGEFAGAPIATDGPGGIKFTLPKDLAGKMVDYGNIIMLIALGTVLYYV